MNGRRRWMKMEKMNEEEDKGKKKIFILNVKPNVFGINVTIA